jgi:CHASE2 domain-containing sensor protein
MLSSRRIIALALVVGLGTCVSALDTRAEDLNTEIVPNDEAPQPKPAPPKAPPEVIKHSDVSLEKDASSNIGHHHYANPAERAQDDLLITEVKSALAEDGISNGYPIEVDADHGTVTLSGVVANRDDVTAAAADAADVNGVVAVKNHLRLH